MPLDVHGGLGDSRVIEHRGEHDDTTRGKVRALLSSLRPEDIFSGEIIDHMVRKHAQQQVAALRLFIDGKRTLTVEEAVTIPVKYARNILGMARLVEDGMRRDNFVRVMQAFWSLAFPQLDFESVISSFSQG